MQELLGLTYQTSCLKSPLEPTLDNCSREDTLRLVMWSPSTKSKGVNHYEAKSINNMTLISFDSSNWIVKYAILYLYHLCMEGVAT